MSPKLYMVRGIVIGFFIGLVFMLPHIYKWMHFPVIYVISVPDSVYWQQGDKRATIKNVMTKKVRKPTQTEVVIAHPDKVRDACRVLSNYKDEECDEVMGFHYYDTKKKKHWVYSVDNTGVLIHEFRHVFEGSYHRSQKDLENGFFCKQFGQN